VNLARARFLSEKRGKEWRPRIGPTAVTILQSRKPNRTVVRITCGDEIGQFVVARPRVDVLLFFATALPAPLLI
jgi:hypothetical protein